VVEKIDFRPDISKRIYKDPHGARTLNRFSRLKIYDDNHGRTDRGAVGIFLDHLKYLSTTESEYMALLNYIAYIVQNPGKKLPYAILIISRFHGIGKSMLEELFRNMFRSETGVDYVGALENEQLASNYTHFLADRIICFVHELSQGDRYGAMNRFKNLITESFVEINGKYAKPYTVRNTTNFFMFSNDPGAIKIDKNDRRLFVVYNDKKPLTPDYYRELFRIFSNHFIDIYNYLLSVNLSKFNPHERPSMTTGKQQLIEQGESELALYLDGLRENGEAPFDGEYLTVEDMRETIEFNAPSIIRGKISAKALKLYLIQNDYVASKRFLRIDGKAINRTFWHPSEHTLSDTRLIELLRKKELVENG